MFAKGLCSFPAYRAKKKFKKMIQFLKKIKMAPNAVNTMMIWRNWL